MNRSATRIIAPSNQLLLTKSQFTRPEMRMTSSWAPDTWFWRHVLAAFTINIAYIPFTTVWTHESIPAHESRCILTALTIPLHTSAYDTFSHTAQNFTPRSYRLHHEPSISGPRHVNETCQPLSGFPCTINILIMRAQTGKVMISFSCWLWRNSYWNTILHNQCEKPTLPVVSYMINILAVQVIPLKGWQVSLAYLAS